MLNNQTESLEERLAKRHRLRDKRFLHRSCIDRSENTLINHSPATQSLDRYSNERVTTTSSSSDQQKSSSTTVFKTSELPSIEKFYSKQPSVFSANKTNSTPLLSQGTKNLSLNSDNDKQILSEPLSNNEQPQNYSHQDEKPVIIKEPVPMTLPSIIPLEKSSVIQQDSYIPENEKSVALARILPSTTFEKSHRTIFRETRVYSTPSQMKTFEEYSSNHSKPITRTISDKSVSNSKHHPIDSIFAKHNSLALPYLFNKRLIDAELARTSSSSSSSFDSKQPHQKTVWD